MQSELPATQSFVALPGGPAVISVLEKRYRDAVVRQTVLATDSHVSGQNFLTVTLYGSVGYQTAEDNALGSDSIAPDRIAKEFGWYLTGVPMTRSPIYAQNKYGPFGFATGTGTGGDNCLYAWQHIGRHYDQIGLTGGSIGVRLRLCDAHASTQQLLTVMYDFAIVGYLPSPSWNPYGKPPEVNRKLGGLSAPVEPILPAETKTQPARIAPHPAAPAPPKVTRPAQGPVVPLPEPGTYDDYANVPPPAT